MLTHGEPVNYNMTLSLHWDANVSVSSIYLSYAWGDALQISEVSEENWQEQSGMLTMTARGTEMSFSCVILNICQWPGIRDDILYVK